MRLSLLVASLAFLPLGSARAADAGSPPNVVVILADDLGYGDLGCYGSKTIRTGMTRVLWPHSKDAPAKLETLTERYFAEANRFIAANKAKPFFLYVPTSMPHLWLAATEAFRGKSKHGLYGDTIEEIDHHVGELLATLKKHDLDRNTIVVFFSDNGPVTSHPQLDPKDPKGSAAPFKLGNGTTWEGGVRVPCVIRWPAAIESGTVVKSPTVVMDLFTTLATAGKCPLPKEVTLDGRDLAPLFAGKPAATDPALFFYRSETLEAVRLGNWKLKAVEQGKGKEVTTEWRLFDLTADPGEESDFSAKFPDRVKELHERMDRWKKGLGVVPKPKL